MKLTFRRAVFSLIPRLALVWHVDHMGAQEMGCVMDYEPTQAFRCRFNDVLAPTPEKALEIDLSAACAIVTDLSSAELYREIMCLLKSDDHYNDNHRAILFLGQIVQKRAFELAARFHDAQ